MTGNVTIYPDEWFALLARALDSLTHFTVQDHIVINLTLCYNVAPVRCHFCEFGTGIITSVTSDCIYDRLLLGLEGQSIMHELGDDGAVQWYIVSLEPFRVLWPRRYVWTGKGPSQRMSEIAA